METKSYAASERIIRKRKSPEAIENVGSKFPLDQLNEDVLEQVLSWLPTSCFVRVSSVCKKWKSIANSATFRLACSQIPFRDPWYFMVDSQSHFSNHQIIFDSAENNWKNLNFPSLFQQKQSSNFVPVASSGGLICFHNAATHDFVVCNPVTGDYHQIVSVCSESSDHPQEIQKNLRAISLISSSDSYKLVLIFGGVSEISFRLFNSTTRQWENEILINKKVDCIAESGESEYEQNAVYFLSKCGNVVSTDLQRSLCKQYSSVISQKHGEEIIYFLSSYGTVVVCNTTCKCFYEYPRLLPGHYEYSIDLVECGGEVFVVVLFEFLESASLRVWRFDEKDKSWDQNAAMPPAMSHEFYGKKMDINCSGFGKQILICLNSAEVCRYFLCNLRANEWIELPNCYVNGEAKEFICAFSFEPRIEACV